MCKQDRNPKQSIPIRYWLVEITLTSGEFLQFYVKALTIKDAYEKADGYVELVSNDVLRNKLKIFKLIEQEKKAVK